MIVKINRRNYQVPTDWNELTGAQLVQITRVLLTPEPNPITSALRLLKIITGMGWWRFFICPAHELHQQLHLVDFIMTANTLTKNLFPVVRSRFKKYYGPGDNFSNLIMDEFAFADEYYLEFRDDETKMEPLNNLVATLYRRAKKGYDHKRNPDGDARVPFNENLSDYHAKRVVAKWSLYKKLAIAQWYGACREQMAKDFPTVFTGGGEPARWGMVSMMRNVAKNGVHGDFKDVERQYVKMILMEMDEMIADSERIEQLQNKQTKI